MARAHERVDVSSPRVPRRVYEILSEVGLTYVEKELAAGRGDRDRLLRDRAVLRRFLGLASGDEAGTTVSTDQ